MQIFTIVKRLFFLITLIACMAQTQAYGRFRVSLVTLGPGNDLLETFGHALIRVVDSNQQTDIAFSYGSFNSSQKYILLKFILGRLPFYLSAHPFPPIMHDYIAGQRVASEQVLSISEAQKQRINDYLLWNALPQNRFYKYQFFRDNCSTRLRDVLFKGIGGHVIVRPGGDTDLTYRNAVNGFLSGSPTARLFFNLLMGPGADRRLTDDDAVFLPVYLSATLARASIGGHNMSATPVLISKRLVPLQESGTDIPLLIGIGLLGFTGYAVFFSRREILRRAAISLLLFASGTVGCLILAMWLVGGYGATAWNLNLLWAIPFNIIVAFYRPRWLRNYASVAALLIFVCIGLSLLGIQVLPIAQLWPWMASLLLIYFSVYRSKAIQAQKATINASAAH